MSLISTNHVFSDLVSFVKLINSSESSKFNGCPLQYFYLNLIDNIESFLLENLFKNKTTVLTPAPGKAPPGRSNIV